MTNLINASGLAESLKTTQDLRQERNVGPYETAVILHLFYPDLWDEIKLYLNNLGEGFDLFVSVCGDNSDAIRGIILKDYPDSFVCKFENRGRDIGPFMEIYPVIAEHYRYICKIHSKKSPHLSAGDVWRQSLYSELLGSPLRVAEIKTLFDQFPTIGLIAPEGQLLRCQSYLDLNMGKVVEISKKIGVNDPEKFDHDFPAGSMFWFKVDALKLLLSLDINQESYEKEQGQLDGTLAHALERVFPLASSVAGFQTVDTHILKIYKELLDEYFSYSMHHSEGFRVTPSVLLRVAKCERQIDALNHQIEEIHRSYSWRITRPLRFIMRRVILKVLLHPYLNPKKKWPTFQIKNR